MISRLYLILLSMTSLFFPSFVTLVHSLLIIAGTVAGIGEFFEHHCDIDDINYPPWILLSAFLQHWEKEWRDVGVELRRGSWFSFPSQVFFLHSFFEHYWKPHNRLLYPITMPLLDQYMKCPFNATCDNLIPKVIVCAGRSIPGHRGLLFHTVCWFSITFLSVTFLSQLYC